MFSWAVSCELCLLFQTIFFPTSSEETNKELPQTGNFLHFDLKKKEKKELGLRMKEGEEKELQ